MKHNALAVHAAKHFWQYYAGALQDHNVHYVEILPLFQVTLHAQGVLYFSAVHLY